MTGFLLSLDEIDRVRRSNHIGTSKTEFAAKAGLSRNTVTAMFADRRPTPQVLDALAQLGARPAHILVAADAATSTTAA